jgi:AP-3 complex subunit sigma
MIKAILIFNNHGKPRLSKFYEYYVSFKLNLLSNFILILFIYKIKLFILKPEDMQQQIIRETFQLVSKRDDNVCNFLEGGR